MSPQSWDNLFMTPGRRREGEKQSYMNYHYYSRKSIIIWNTLVIRMHLAKSCLPFLPTFVDGKWPLAIKMADIECLWACFYLLYDSWKHEITATSFTTKVKVIVSFSCCCVHLSTSYVHSVQKFNFRLGSQGKHHTLVTAASQLLSASAATNSHVHLCHVG